MHCEVPTVALKYDSSIWFDVLSTIHIKLYLLKIEISSP